MSEGPINVDSDKLLSKVRQNMTRDPSTPAQSPPPEYQMPEDPDLEDNEIDKMIVADIKRERRRQMLNDYRSGAYGRTYPGSNGQVDPTIKALSDQVSTLSKTMDNQVSALSKMIEDDHKQRAEDEKERKHKEELNALEGKYDKIFTDLTSKLGKGTPETDNQILQYIKKMDDERKKDKEDQQKRWEEEQKQRSMDTRMTNFETILSGKIESIRSQLSSPNTGPGPSTGSALSGLAKELNELLGLLSVLEKIKGQPSGPTKENDIEAFGKVLNEGIKGAGNLLNVGQSIYDARHPETAQPINAPPPPVVNSDYQPREKNIAPPISQDIETYINAGEEIDDPYTPGRKVWASPYVLPNDSKYDRKAYWNSADQPLLKIEMRNWAITKPDEFRHMMDADRKHYDEAKTRMATPPPAQTKVITDGNTGQSSSNTEGNPAAT